MTRRIIFSIFVVLFISSCAAPSEESSVTTATVPFATLTLAISPTVSPSQSPLPVPPQPTVASVEGTTSTQINVRAEPSTASSVLGIIPANTKVQIRGKDPAGNWLQILYPQGVDGKGWVTAQYILTVSGTEIPMIGSDASNSVSGNVAIVQQQLNVRSGPGTGFDSLGTLNAKDVVNLIGKDANGAWLQIQFSSGPDGKGWVNAAFVQAKGVENVPIVNQGGDILGTGTPTSLPSTPTATVLPAWLDNDSQNNPIASVVFEPLGTHTLIYSGDVSAPTGDSQDWIQFIPYTDQVNISLQCNRNNLNISLLENGQVTRSPLTCNDPQKELKVNKKAVYVIVLQAPQFSGALQYFQYSITIAVGQ